MLAKAISVHDHHISISCNIMDVQKNRHDAVGSGRPAVRKIAGKLLSELQIVCVIDLPSVGPWISSGQTVGQ